MKRLVFIGILAIAVVVVALIFRSARLDEESPNLLVISVDTLRPDHLGCYGYTRPTSPAIDALVRDGVVFTQAVCQIPNTAPSFCSIFTGTYPHTHGTRTNGMPLPEQAVTLAEWLKARGYHTAAFVSSYTTSDESSGLSQGFDHFDDDFAEKERTAEDTNARLFEHLDRLPGAPYFIWTHYFEPHGPYEMHPGSRVGPPGHDSGFPVNTMEDAVLEPPRWIQKELGLDHHVWLYDGEIAHADDQVARLLNEFDGRGLLENTLIVFISDHGESFDHGYYCAHGVFLYESSIRIPLAFVFPDGRFRGRVVDDLVQSIDVMPTICDVLDIRQPEIVEGTSLMPVVSGTGAGGGLAYLERRFRMNRRRVGFQGEMYAIRTPKWKYILDSLTGEELYRVTTDPGEKENLAAVEPEISSAFREELEAWIAAETPPSGIKRRISEDGLEKLKALGYVQ